MRSVTQDSRTTSSMLWKYRVGPTLTAKGLGAGTVGKTGTIGPICYQFAT
jgi:hypothetical protein